MNSLLWAFFCSMLPIVELRGGMPIAMAENSFWLSYPVCVLGNMLPIPFILLFAKTTLSWFATKRDMDITAENSFLKLFQKCLKGFGTFCHKLILRADEKARTIGTYELWGLFLFVAIPLPGTGAWTGSLIASLMRFKVRESLPWIFLGVVVAGLIMSLLAFGIIKQVI